MMDSSSGEWGRGWGCVGGEWVQLGRYLNRGSVLGV